MWRKINPLIFGVALSIVVFSCESEPEDYKELLISFSNGITLDQDDLVFYDSTECIFLLKDTINFKYRSGTDPPGIEYVNFSISLDRDTIYRGIIYRAESNMQPPDPIYIACYEQWDSFNRNILDVKYWTIPAHGEFDPRNDDRLISYYKKMGILRNGITVTLDSVKISPENDSNLITTITIINHDNINYYLPDPFIMGSMHYNFFLGGLQVFTMGTVVSAKVDYSVVGGPESYRHKIENMSMIKGYSKVTQTYTSMYPTFFEKNSYGAYYRYGVLRGFTTVDIPLQQDKGWIWVGDKNWYIDNLLIE